MHISYWYSNEWHKQRRALCVAFFVFVGALRKHLVETTVCWNLACVHVRACTTNVHRAHAKRGKKYIIPRCGYVRIFACVWTHARIIDRVVPAHSVLCWLFVCGSVWILITHIGDMLGGRVFVFVRVFERVCPQMDLLFVSAYTFHPHMRV